MSTPVVLLALLSTGNNTEWTKFFLSACKNWRNSVLRWSRRDKGRSPLLVVTYEGLANDTLTEMEKMLRFLRLPFERGSLEKRLKEDFSTFRRHSGSGRDPSTVSGRVQHFTPDQWEHLQEMLTEVHGELQKTDQSLLASILQFYIRVNRVSVDSNAPALHS